MKQVKLSFIERLLIRSLKGFTKVLFLITIYHIIKCIFKSVSPFDLFIHSRIFIEGKM